MYIQEKGAQGDIWVERELIGQWRKLHNEEVHHLYPTLIIDQIMEMVITHDVREKKNADTVLVGKPEGKKPFGRSKRRLEDDIKMDPK